jgi:hypothetical protein
MREGCSAGRSHERRAAAPQPQGGGGAAAPATVPPAIVAPAAALLTLRRASYSLPAPSASSPRVASAAALSRSSSSSPAWASTSWGAVGLGWVWCVRSGGGMRQEESRAGDLGGPASRRESMSRAALAAGAAPAPRPSRAHRRGRRVEAALERAPQRAALAVCQAAAPRRGRLGAGRRRGGAQPRDRLLCAGALHFCCGAAPSCRRRRLGTAVRLGGERDTQLRERRGRGGRRLGRRAQQRRRGCLGEAPEQCGRRRGGVVVFFEVGHRLVLGRFWAGGAGSGRCTGTGRLRLHL